jgi:hypothetical protein
VKERGLSSSAVSAELPPYEPPQEPSRGYDPMEISQPPQHGAPKWVLPAALLAVVGIGAGAALYAQRTPRTSEGTTTTSAATVSLTAASTPSASVEAPVTSLAPLTSAPPRPVGSTHGVRPAAASATASAKAAATVTATVTATGDSPPPNPYN